MKHVFYRWMRFTFGEPREVNSGEYPTDKRVKIILLIDYRKKRAIYNKKYQRENREKIRKYKREYYQKNKSR